MMFDTKGRYVIKDYQARPPFSSFLPGIAGSMGVPVWCYYNNRGQGVCTFGAKDKDHAIMEFSPAYESYREVSRTGFRTFCKINETYRELFTGGCDMHIGGSELEIVCQSDGLEASAVYFGVPSERTAALARILTVRNTSESPIELELLDGMPEVVPYGVNQDTLKNMSNLAAAWMQTEDAAQGLTCFRVRASMADTAIVTKVEGCNFCLAWDETGTRLCPLVQQELVFGMDTSLTRPENFLRMSLGELCALPQMTENRFPCCFLPKRAVLQPGDAVNLFSLYGQAEDKSRIAALAERVTGGEWFAQKRQEAAELVETLCTPISCRTGDKIFDAYCRQTYLDNLLRGGTPTFFENDGKVVPFYLYSRKHGDPEREYNYFSLGGEYYAQGNGNFRDVNQNRRCDVQFHPKLRAENIHTFFDLIQTDGYNPLVLTASTYTLQSQALPELLSRIPAGYHRQASELLSHPFTPGALAMAAEDWGLSGENIAALVSAAVCTSDHEPNAEFSEGYWCDHWTYNLDLIESYLAVYPENKEDLLFSERRYRWYESRARILPRTKRYCSTENGLRQYHALDEEAKAETSRKWAMAGKQEARSTLIEKMILLCAIKTATLDAAGMGIEMEGGKPGWYDALNGLPGLLGSSMAESCELARFLCFAIQALESKDVEIELYEEIAWLLEAVDEILQINYDVYVRWDRLNCVKEDYRSRTACGFSGVWRHVGCKRLAAMLKRMEKTVSEGIRAAVRIGNGICPTYFIFEAADTVSTPDGGLMPLNLTPHVLPLFLEGPVRWLKLEQPAEKKRMLAERVRESGLYDQTLRMYKVNENLASVSFEAGRAKAFTPGWLENESVWLHMEYKYLLELLKSGLYDIFAEAFHDAAIPFLDPAKYGRSPLENVSFLASSANPDPSVWGRGFVARLSGSTAEFLQIWQIMFFGMKPFRWDGEELRLTFEPFLPKYLMPEDGVVRAVFLGSVDVTYDAPGCKELIPGQCKPVCWELTAYDGIKQVVNGTGLSDKEARAVRDGRIAAIYITIK